MSKQHVTADHEEHTEEDKQNGAESSARSVSNRSEVAKRKKDRRMTAGTHWLFQLGVYKRSQGRVIRQITFFALLAAIALGAWRLSEFAHRSGLKYGVPFAILVVGGWLVYRLVNLPRFADFLIAVEAEMTKVSWPTRHELIRSSMVVIFTIIGFAVLLWFYDTFWSFLLGLLHM
ncbi:MAG TPA: preprotein translocase subunit SecE [Pirellulales bacterium]|nr:preprotein translocase subunit SecE [Pirellulales bacterium]